MYRSVLAHDDFIRWSRDAVVALVAHNEKAHEETEGLDSYGSPARRCSLYPGLACNEHVDAAVDVDTARGDGLVKVPFLELHPNTWLVPPTGEVARVEEADQFEPAKVRAQVEALQKTLGAPVRPKDYPRLREAAAKADAALDESRLREALDHLAALGKALKTPHASLKAFLEERLARLEKYARWEFEEVRDDKALDAKGRHARFEKLLTDLDVEVLGGRLPVVADLKAALGATK